MSAITMIASLLFFYGVHLAYAQTYVGCYYTFHNATRNFTLPPPSISHPDTPAKCIKTCRFHKHKYAALMNGDQCYCINEYGKSAPNSCNNPCFSDSHNYCGSHEAMSVYETSQPEDTVNKMNIVPSPPREIQISQNGSDALVISWQPPNITNGDITFYIIRAVPIKKYATNALLFIENKIQGDSNNITLRGFQPGTTYNVSITAINKNGSSDKAYTVTSILIGPPDKPPMPEILQRNNNTITVKLAQGHSECGPISRYQVVVVQAGTIPPIGPDVEYLKYNEALEEGYGYYVAAEFDSSDFHRYKRFVVGDGQMIGGYYNAPLKDNFVNPQIGLVVISQEQMKVQRAYSNMANNMIRTIVRTNDDTTTSQMNSTALVLCIAITLFSILLAVSILLYFVLRRRHERFNMHKLPERQELTLQGPLYEVDNVGYIPEDIPERVNHYQELKKKVWNIPRSALFVDNFIVRRGRFGTVHTGTVLKNDTSYPVTIHTIADGALKGSDKRHMLRELDVCIRTGTMRYLAGLVGTCETPDTLYVAIELPPQILKSRLLSARSGDAFPVDRILSISSSTAKALQYLASHNIIHSHFCARSVGLSHDWTPKLMGHGIAKYALEDIKYVRWTAVENFDNQKRQQQSVVWAFGVFLWELFSMGGTPYSNLMLDSEVENAVMQGVRLPQLLDVPDPIYEVMLSCWRNDLEERPTFDELARMDTLCICPITAITEPYIPELELN